MFEVNLEENLEREIKIIAERNGFRDTHFYTRGYESGRSISLLQARTKNPEEITFSFFSLYPISEVYKVSPETAKEMIEVVCLHERAHYDFPNPPHADNQQVQEKAARRYGNYVRFVKADSLLLFYLYPPKIEDGKFKLEISEYIDKFKGLTPRDKEEIERGLVKIKKAKTAKFFGKSKIRKALEDFL